MESKRYSTDLSDDEWRCIGPHLPGPTTLDEALFETAHLIAGLAAADGAVVMGKQNELLGFGGMISGRLPDVWHVWRALSLEGEEVAEEETGTWAPGTARPTVCATRCPDRWRSWSPRTGTCVEYAGKTAASRTGSRSEPNPGDREEAPSARGW